MVDASLLVSKGFRPPFGLERVTLERPKVTKGLLPHFFARLRRVPSAHPHVRRHAPTGHPWPGATRSTSCLATWTSVLASAN